MGKVVKFCSTCDESFAEKFGFCPTCGATLQAFEMNPLAAEPAAVVEPVAETVAAPIEVAAVEEVVEEKVVEPIVETPVVAEVVAPVVVAPPAPIFIQKEAKDADAVAPKNSPTSLPPTADDDGYHITVIEEKNVGQRNSLLLGTLGVMVVMLMSGVVYSLFSKDLGIDAIDDGMFNAVLLEDPDSIEFKEEEEKKAKDDDGGGGGGGNNDPNPASKGVRPPMMKDPQFAPSAHMERLTNPSIPIQVAIKGPINETKQDPSQRYGIDTSKYGTISDGPGSGGGIGTGRNGGVGSGNGPGAGSGSGGGLGSGTGGNIGDGDGTGGSRTTPPPLKAGVTQGLKIISKPKATYTDAARQNQVQGSVTLRITFLANGSIGSITPVSGLGYGLTEQAIAAARRIQFEPAKSNGVAQTVTKTFQYGFTIY